MDWNIPIGPERKIKLNKIEINSNLTFELTFDEKWFIENDIITNDIVDLQIIQVNDYTVIAKTYEPSDIISINKGDYFKIKR